MTRRLVLNLKGEYFDAIKAGEKTHEFRLCTPHWSKRLVGKEFDEVVIRRGYPKAGDPEREIVQPWRGFHEQMITHPHFGPRAVQVFAIRVLP